MGKYRTVTDLKLWILINLLLGTSFVRGANFKIGALLNSDKSASVVAHTVDYVNSQQLLGPGHRLEYVINVTGSITSFNNIQNACYQLDEGIVAIIGPLSSTAVKAVAPISQAYNIPLIAPTATDPTLGLKDLYPTILRMMAPDSIQSMALVSLVHAYGWTNMAILTSKSDYGVNGLVQFQAEASRRKWRITSVLRFSVGENINVTSQLQLIQRSGVRVVILNCLAEFGVQVMAQAEQLGMADAGWAWLVTDGITTENYYSEDGTVTSYMRGLLGTRPASQQGALWGDMQRSWRAQMTQDNSTGAMSNMETVDEYLMDSILVVAYALAAMIQDGAASGLSSTGANCSQLPVIPWSAGTKFLEYMAEVDADGVAAHISSNSKLYPARPVYHIVNLDQDGWHKVGEWSEGSTITIDRNRAKFMGGKPVISDFVSSLANRTIRTVTIEEPPFIIIKDKSKPLDKDNVTPGVHIEGFCVDLMDKLAEMIGFNYTVYYVKDDMFGSKNPVTNQWNGMLKDLVDRKVDLALSDLTITHTREQDIDFTKPYLDLGLTFLMKVEEPEVPSPFRFLDPFSTPVWIYILVTTALVAVCVSLYNKISPYDHHGTFIYVDEPAATEDSDNVFKEYKKMKKLKMTAISEMNLTNAVWFSVGALLQQGGECYPKSFSARVTVIMWWFGIMIIIATYTANLAAFLTASRQKTDINSIEDLLAQTKISYGTVIASAPYQQMLLSEVPLYREMGNFMLTRNTLQPNGIAAVEKVRQGGFAFIWDSAVLDYEVEQRPCNTIRTVGRLFGKIGYGMALQKNSPYQAELSTYILQLREMGFMDDLKRKWYQERGQCQTGGGDAEQEAVLEDAGGKLHISHMLGVFYIIYGGQVLGLLVLVFEWIVKCISAVDVEDPLSPHSFRESIRRRWQQMVKDLKETIHGSWPFCNHGDVTEPRDVTEASDVADPSQGQTDKYDGSRNGTPSVISGVFGGHGDAPSGGVLANSKISNVRRIEGASMPGWVTGATGGYSINRGSAKPLPNTADMGFLSQEDRLEDVEANLRQFSEEATAPYSVAQHSLTFSRSSLEQFQLDECGPEDDMTPDLSDTGHNEATSDLHHATETACPTGDATSGLAYPPCASPDHVMPGDGGSQIEVIPDQDCSVPQGDVFPDKDPTSQMEDIPDNDGVGGSPAQMPGLAERDGGELSDEPQTVTYVYDGARLT